jgi:hypothetical protein
MTTLQEKILSLLEIDVLDIEAEIEECLPANSTRWIVRKGGLLLCEVSNAVPEASLFGILTALVPNSKLDSATAVATEFLNEQKVDFDYF